MFPLPVFILTGEVLTSVRDAGKESILQGSEEGCEYKSAIHMYYCEETAKQGISQ
jgi:hypothetical protein